MDQKGQQTATKIMVLVIAGISLMIGVYVFGEIEGAMGDTASQFHSFALSNPTFDNNASENWLESWTVSDSGVASTAIDNANNWVNVTASGSGSGTSLVKQGVSVSIHDEVRSASVSAKWQIPTADNLENENVRVKIKDPGGNVDTIAENLNVNGTLSWQAVDNDVSSYIDEDGSYELQLEVETQDNGTTYEHNWDNANLNVRSAEDPVGNIIGDLWGAFGMTPIILIVLIAGMIIFVLTRFRA